jgi:hypothetical protein
MFLVFVGVSVLIAGAILTMSGKPWGFWTFFKTSAIVFACLGMLLNFISLFNTPMGVDAGDIYGEYVIDRGMFPGKNADWQYQTYRFEITKADELKLHQLRDGQVVAIHQVPVEMLERYSNTRLKLLGGEVPRHHMLRNSPLMVRRPWSFYYVFNSPHYGNMYFEKKKWWMW